MGTVNDGFESCSVKYAGKVFTMFRLLDRRCRLGVPAVPLSDLVAPVSRLAQSYGVALVKAGVETMEKSAGERLRVSGGGEDYSADAVILATGSGKPRSCSRP